MKRKSLFGAQYETDGVSFNLWCSQAPKVQLVLDPLGHPRYFNLEKKDKQNIFNFFVPGVKPGEQYAYQLEGHPFFPDPASRYQPLGVHGPSEIVDSAAFSWTDQSWKGLPLPQLIFYEVHIGAFSPEGTFEGVRSHLSHLKDLGVTALELMPVADFPGARNWGYDGASLYAPAHLYGRPDDLRRLVDEAHRQGIAVFLDVVYNHLGPDGNYLPAFSREIFSTQHKSEWGAGINFDGNESFLVRQFFIENALSWIDEYHLDGLRLDATFAIVDESPRHFLAELSETVAAAQFPRQVHLIAEDDRNFAKLVTPLFRGGWGIDAVWADDFHHQMRCHMAGDHYGYYQDYTGSPEDIVKTAAQGWFYTGQLSPFSGKFRGTDPSGLSPDHFVYCLENHDQIGNRPLGERLHHQIDAASYRAALSLFLTLPYLPLLFMGQEWAASSPFLFFTDHNAELGQKISEGRREEFKKIPGFDNPSAQEKIMDAQDPRAFEQSKLRWQELGEPSHQLVFRLTRRLLGLRREHPAFKEMASWSIHQLGPSGFLVGQNHPLHPIAAVILLKDSAKLMLEGKKFTGFHKILFTTEDFEFSLDPQPVQKDLTEDGVMSFSFQRPGAVLMEFTPLAQES